MSPTYGPTMSEEAQSVILEATEWSFPASTADNMSDEWQQAVLEAVSDSEEELECVKVGLKFEKKTVGICQ
jgi:hypothetical protein